MHTIATMRLWFEIMFVTNRKRRQKMRVLLQRKAVYRLSALSHVTPSLLEALLHVIWTELETYVHLHSSLTRNKSSTKKKKNH